MRYNPKARLDRSQVEVRRGGGGSSGGLRLPGGGGSTGMRVGGGIGGLVVLVLVLVLQGTLGGGSGLTGDGGGSETSGALEGCNTGADAQRDQNCALLADVNSVQAYWSEELPRQAGLDYRRSVTTVFEDGTSTGCGSASSATGPFYCPVDERVYLDPTFFDDMLEGSLGAQGGPFAEAYVLAHEYGHHVQNLTGQLGRVRTQQGPTSDAVRLELQADCYAGMWSRAATSVDDESGEAYILDLTDDDIARALDAARAVGDDRIQQQSGGRIDPDRWTHGSADQRMRWFRVGLDQGSMAACDTFAADRL